MEYVYAAMLLHAAKQPINEENLSKTLHGAGVQTDSAKVKAVVAALEGINIEEAISKAAVAVAAAPAAGGAAPAAAAKEDEKKQEQAAEEAAAGLGALFG